MAIEFNCPNCNAIIRVPDNAGGGKGRCPRCNTRIKVPKASTPKVPKKEDADELEIFAQPGDEEAATEFPSVEPEQTDSEPQTLEGMFAPRSRGLGEFPVEVPRKKLPAGAMTSQLKRKQSGVPWQIPVLFGLMLCGAFGWYYWQQQQSMQLSGELVAETAPVLDLKPVELSASIFRKSSDEMKKYLEALQKSPIPQTSTLMQVTISASTRAVNVAVSAGTQTQFYRVAVRNDAALMKFRTDRGVELEEKRMADIESAGGDFLQAYQRILDKETGNSVLNDFRDSLALPALVRGLGYQVLASSGRTYRCVYEDTEGALYFLMPPGIQEFEIVGRKHKDGKTLFAGKYKVKVGGEINGSAKDKKSKKASETEEEKPGMSETGDEGEMKEMKKEMDDGDMKMDEKPKKKKPDMSK